MLKQQFAHTKKCPTCDFVTQSKSKMMRHVKTVHRWEALNRSSFDFETKIMNSETLKTKRTNATKSSFAKIPFQEKTRWRRTWTSTANRSPTVWPPMTMSRNRFTNNFFFSKNLKGIVYKVCVREGFNNPSHGKFPWRGGRVPPPPFPLTFFR